MKTPPARTETIFLSKVELHCLADGMLLEEPGMLERCLDFVLSETHGHWHNRARAMMCRRLKHCPLTPMQQTQLVASITGRLENGVFTEQFKDQLRLALHLDPAKTREACRRALTSPKPYVRRYAEWGLSRGNYKDAL